jgi:mycothiol synthase
MIATMTHDPIANSSVLRTEGLTIRNWRENADFEKMSRVLIAGNNADHLEEARTGQDLQNMYERMKNFEPTRNLFLVEHGSELVAYAGCRWWEENDAKFIHVHWIFVLPEWRGRGIENELLHIAQQRLREYIKSHPQDATNWFESFVADSQHWLRNLLETDGYQPMRYFYDMVRADLQDLPDVELPAGIETRPAKPEDYRQIWDAQEEAFRDHWGEAVLEEGDFERWIANSIWDQSLWQVAWEGDQVVGMVLNYVNANENNQYNFKRGYTENISVRKPWRGRGIAKALLVRSMKMFRDMGFDNTALGVDTENATGALHLYECVGYKTVRTVMIHRKKIETGD